MCVVYDVFFVLSSVLCLCASYFEKFFEKFSETNETNLLSTQV